MARTAKKPAAEQREGRTYKLIDLVGTSPHGHDDAIRRAVADASRTLRGLAWFEVTELRGLIQDGKVVEYQSKLRIGFRILPEE